MPPTKRARIAIADEEGSAENDETHGLVDLAAALADDTWETTAMGKNAALLEAAVGAIVEKRARGVSDSLTTLACVREEAIRYGARLGFALARTVPAADQGWPAWLKAAEDWLAQANCLVEEHQKTYSEACADEAEKLASFSADASKPPAAVISVMQQITGMVEDIVKIHERRHHVNSEAPPQEPPGQAPPVSDEASAPTPPPTVEPQPKRRPAAAKAATAPPARHRASDAGHIATAVPQLDQCAGDDLELAGHEHSRASDTWIHAHQI